MPTPGLSGIPRHFVGGKTERNNEQHTQQRSLGPVAGTVEHGATLSGMDLPGDGRILPGGSNVCPASAEPLQGDYDHPRGSAEGAGKVREPDRELRSGAAPEHHFATGAERDAAAADHRRYAALS